MLQWYQTVFDARIPFEGPGLTFLTYDDEHHRFALVNMALLQPEGTDTDKLGAIGVDHVAYTYGSLRELLENYAQLKERGILPYWCIHHGATVSMYYADPDGNQMEFQVDCYPTSEETNAYLRSPGFRANPIGVEYDPDAWLARLRGGVPATEFLIRTSDQPISPIRGAGMRAPQPDPAAR